MVYVDGDRKSLLMCTKDRQTFPPIETFAIPPPAMPATPFCMYFFACYVEFYQPYLQW
jgi:hypothetical protein